MGYGDVDRERRISEPPKRPGRSEFERDRARLVHSAALRRLAAKTQVLGPGTDDFVRNRLTHTLEVAQVGRELGRSLGCDPDVVDTACLAHDLGHPPFGHNGERALAEVADAAGGFEGNAQTFRVLTRLEAKTIGTDGRSAGLNLTRASLDAVTKYPWPRAAAPAPYGMNTDDATPRRIVKFGVYEDDLDTFAWVRAPVPGHGADRAHRTDSDGSPPRCLEAQVMDLADDIAYCVHDVEDGVVGGRIQLAKLNDGVERKEVWDAVRDWYQPGVTDDELSEAWARLRTAGFAAVTAYDGSRGALAALKSLTSSLIGRFCMAAQQATHAKYGPAPLARYAADLAVPAEVRTEIAVLKGIAAHYVMRTGERADGLAAERDVVADLVHHILAGAADRLEPQFAGDWAQAADDAARLRVVVDQVASLTDAAAVRLHASINR